MKKLSIEEKAKAYDEVSKEVKDYFEGRQKMYSDVTQTLEYLFPELKESEDERIRKALINGFNKLDKSAVWYNGITNGQILAWLEKQGEQKPAWSEEDEKMLDDIHEFFDKHKINPLKHDMDDYAKFIKSLKDRVQPQSKQEWSEEDEEHLSDAIFFVREYQIPTRDKKLLEAAKKAEDWLKSLRPQNRWKPSDEQMRVLDLAIRCGINRGTTEETTLASLFNDLKKLK